MAECDTRYVDTPELLHTCTQQLAQCKVICIDTEFHRETTYYPEFALLQAYGNGCCWLVDPLALKDLSPLWAIMTNSAILKVFHAGRQDLEIILQQSGHLPHPIFDTQIAASLLGFGQQIGFGNLVQRVLKKTLAKQESYSDWMARPLRPQQLSYAANDVIYLMPVYQTLNEQLEARGRRGWLEEEQAALCDQQSYEEDSSTVFWRCKGSNRLRGRALAVLRELAAWREQEARKRNLPRRRLIQDEPLLEMARREHLDIDTMRRMRGLSSGLIRRFGDELIRVWQQGQLCDKQHWPKAPSSPLHTAGTELRLELLNTLVRLRADACDVASCILVKRSELAELASWGREQKGPPPELDCLKGWRGQLIGDDLLRLLRGELCLCLDPGTGLPKIARMCEGTL